MKSHQFRCHMPNTMNIHFYCICTSRHKMVLWCWKQHQWSNSMFSFCSHTSFRKIGNSIALDVQKHIHKGKQKRKLKPASVGFFSKGELFTSCVVHRLSSCLARVAVTLHQLYSFLNQYKHTTSHFFPEKNSKEKKRHFRRVQVTTVFEHHYKFKKRMPPFQAEILQSVPYWSARMTSD